MEFERRVSGTFAAGDPVVVHGLTSAQEHNGATGVIVDGLNEAGRHGVAVCLGEKSRRLRVKPGNLRRIDRAVTFSATQYAYAECLSPDLFERLATSFQAAKPWELPRCEETVFSVGLVDEAGRVLREVCCSVTGHSSGPIEQRDLEARVARAQEAGPDEMARLKAELDRAESAYGVRMTQSYAHHEQVLLGAPRNASPLLANVGRPGGGGAPSVARYHRAEDPDDEEIALLFGAMDVLPDFMKLLRSDHGLPKSFAVPIAYGRYERSYPLRHELSLYLLEPGERTKYALRLRHPAVDTPRPRDTLKARKILWPRLPLAARAAVPREGFKAGDGYVTIRDAVAYHRTQLEALPEEAAPTHSLALAIALAECRTEADHREAMALCKVVADAPKAGIDLAAAARRLLLELTGDAESESRATTSPTSLPPIAK